MVHEKSARRGMWALAILMGIALLFPGSALAKQTKKVLALRTNSRAVTVQPLERRPVDRPVRRYIIRSDNPTINKVWVPGHYAVSKRGTRVWVAGHIRTVH
ncbi:MAG: hypothetical protein KBD56_00860 [Candidatus Eisenbacteria bacterium]|nr:hypothetical protein [Candidatus Eisenbacteria bacterium]